MISSFRGFSSNGHRVQILVSSHASKQTAALQKKRYLQGVVKENRLETLACIPFSLVLACQSLSAKLCFRENSTCSV